MVGSERDRAWVCESHLGSCSALGSCSLRKLPDFGEPRARGPLSGPNKSQGPLVSYTI